VISCAKLCERINLLMVDKSLTLNLGGRYIFLIYIEMNVADYFIGKTLS
jgi:hypothetical protein